MSPSYQATFTSDSRSVALARNAIARFARMCGFNEDSVADISLATGEALSNAVQWGQGHRGGGFSVACTFDGDELRIDVQDSGKGFKPGSNGGGFGTVIMRSLMNSINYSRGGTHVRLVKRR